MAAIRSETIDSNSIRGSTLPGGYPGCRKVGYSLTMSKAKKNISVLLATMLLMVPASSWADAQGRPRSGKAAELSVTLERTGCFGTCPAYTVSIHGDGRVVFYSDPFTSYRGEGEKAPFALIDGVLLPGHHKDFISSRGVARLVRAARKIPFDKLQPEYRAPIADLPTYTLTVESGLTRRMIVDHSGPQVGLPASVTKLQLLIDELAGVSRWVRGSSGLTAWLEREKFDFQSIEASQLAVAAALGDGAQETIAGLVERGAPLEVAVTPSSSWRNSREVSPGTAGMLIFESAMRRGHGLVFRALVKKGWLEKYGPANAAILFARFGAGCSADLVEAAAQAGIPIDVDHEPRLEATADDPLRQTALATLAHSTVCENGEGARVEAIERLLSKGASPNSQNSLGQTPLYGIQSIGVANVLLKHGADASITDKTGQSMVFGTTNDAVVYRLLSAGASPVGTYPDGRSLFDLAKSGKMPQTSKWLSKHGPR